MARDADGRGKHHNLTWYPMSCCKETEVRKALEVRKTLIKFAEQVQAISEQETEATHQLVIP